MTKHTTTMAAEVLASLAWRWPADRTDLAPAAAIHVGAIQLAEAITAKRDEVGLNPDLTPGGQVRAFREWGRQHARTELARLIGKIEAQRELIAEERQRLRQPKVEPGDVVAEMQRQEARVVLRSLSELERQGALLVEDDLAEAALGAHRQWGRLGSACRSACCLRRQAEDCAEFIRA